MPSITDRKPICLTVNRIKKWPPLSWTCKIDCESANITAWCGSFVEKTECALFEAVWDGNVSPLDIDQSSLVCGTGLVIRDNKITFVTSSNTVDRLWLIKTKSGGWVGNSLPALLAVSKNRLKDEYLSYFNDLRSINNGIDRYVQKMPLHEGTVEVIYFQNLTYNLERWRRVDKNDNTPSFDSFDAYYSYLLDSATSLATNANAKQREHKVEILTTISTGYDSPTAAILAKHAGCKKAFTLTKARSLLTRSDSGLDIANRLNLECEEYESPKSITSDAEPYFWAVRGEPADANISVFDFPKTPSILFTGYNGDVVWGNHDEVQDNLIVRKGLTGLGLCEYRLKKTFFHCPVPFWGITRANELQALSKSSELKHWSVEGNYDRPICRKIIEDAGVPRDWFGTQKKATTFSPVAERRPINKSAKRRFKKYIKACGAPLIPQWILRVTSTIDEEIITRLSDILNINLPKFNINGQAEAMTFHWAVSELVTRYENGLIDKDEN